jgi:acetolactate synthase-1/2/3 large subunit
MRVSDRIAELVSESSIKDVFMVTGGGSMHLNDALSRNSKLNVINMHHEQACTMAAEGYAKLSGRPACVNVTTGPGGINAINGVYGAWTDSMPMIIISGQVKKETLNLKSSKLRQLGDQENDIISMVKKITKFSYQLKNQDYLDDVLSHAISLSTSGRPGPVWIDVPMDIQGAIYNPSKQKKLQNLPKYKSPKVTKDDLKYVLNKINSSKNPAIIAGGGIRASNSHDEFLKFINKSDIPVLTAWNAHDVIENSHKNYVGRPGTVGDRAGNFVIETCDLLIILGSRLNIRQIGYNFKSFSPNSYKIMVDIDSEEINKKTLNIDKKLNYDLKDFLSELNKITNNLKNKNHKAYLEWSKGLAKQFPVFNEKYAISKLINPYYFGEVLFKALKKEDIVITSDGTAVVTTFQIAKLKKGQRLFSNSGSASMGYGLPAAIGASFSSGKSNIVCIEGDGSLQMNIQELATVSYHKLPIKIFVFSNDGYHSIRQTQSKYFPDNVIGCGVDSGLTFPDLKFIAKAYGIEYIKIANSKNIKDIINKILSKKNAIICDVVLDKSQEFEPKASSKLYEDGKMKSAPLYDMYPFLPEDEINNILDRRN